MEAMEGMEVRAREGLQARAIHLTAAVEEGTQDKEEMGERGAPQDREATEGMGVTPRFLCKTVCAISLNSTLKRHSSPPRPDRPGNLGAAEPGQQAAGRVTVMDTVEVVTERIQAPLVAKEPYQI
jgi:hypothetical protein